MNMFSKKKTFKEDFAHKKVCDTKTNEQLRKNVDCWQIRQKAAVESEEEGEGERIKKENNKSKDTGMLNIVHALA